MNSASTFVAISLALPLSLSSCVDSKHAADEHAIPIGALLPFTGESVSGANIERALLMGAEEINKAGGVAGKNVRIVARNTKSDPSEGVIACHQLIEDDGVQVIIGPDEEAVAGLVLPIIQERGVLMISAGLTSPLLLGLSPPENWFRVTPSPLLLGTALATKMREDGAKRVTVLWAEGDDFASGFSGVVSKAFRTQGGEVLEAFAVGQSERSYADLVTQTLADEPDAIVLVTYPESGSHLVQEIAAVAPTMRWYLAPTLKTPQFVTNVLPGAASRMAGVSLAVSNQASSFERAFKKRWDGEQPSVSAHYFYDALLLLALSMESAAEESGGVPDVAAIREAIRPISAPPGKSVQWSDLREGLKRVRAGEDVDYSGVSGALDINDSGEVERGNYVYWKISNRQIVDE